MFFTSDTHEELLPLERAINALGRRVKRDANLSPEVILAGRCPKVMRWKRRSGDGVQSEKKCIAFGDGDERR
ncbi:hypothetical protein KCP75_21065 [Salmonella enterica subsp. enterica]|nr:hypothetical protein KCP75_21065 [Salmonella enterica subsp. enterica]